MHLHSKLLLASSLCALCAVALPTNAVSQEDQPKKTHTQAPDSPQLAELKTMLAGITNLDQKLDFLKKNLAADPSNAAVLAREVTASCPLSDAVEIATVIGKMYESLPALIKQAPEIAAEMTRAIIAKGTIEQTRPVVANSVAALTVLLPGSVSSNKTIITNIGKQVAAVIAEKNSGMATTIVAITSVTLKSVAGPSDITNILEAFAAEFKDAIPDPIIQAKLDTLVSQINLGQSDKNITALEPALQENIPSTQPTPIPVPTPLPSPTPPLPTPTPTPKPTPEPTPPQESPKTNG